jgi:hypothetical protein
MTPRTASLVSQRGKIVNDGAKRECTVEEINALTRILQETAGVMQDLKTQQDRYHALGY